jgi:hypothetical protein
MFTTDEIIGYVLLAIGIAGMLYVGLNGSEEKTKRRKEKMEREYYNKIGKHK